MTLKNDRKFGKKSTCCFKIDMTNLTNFDLEHQSTCGLKNDMGTLADFHQST